MMRTFAVSALALMLTTTTGVAAPAPTDLETVTIGDQVWLARNLDATHFANGDPIPRITGEAAWATAGASGAPAQSAYDNDETRVARDDDAVVVGAAMAKPVASPRRPIIESPRPRAEAAIAGW